MCFLQRNAILCREEGCKVFFSLYYLLSGGKGMGKSKYYKIVLLLFLCTVVKAIGCKKVGLFNSDQKSKSKFEAPAEVWETTLTQTPEHILTQEPEPILTKAPEQINVTPAVQVLHTETEINSAGESVRSVYTLEGDIVVLNKYKQDVLVRQEKWKEGALEFYEGRVFETPLWSFWWWMLDGEDIYATTYTEAYTDDDGTLHRLKRGALDGGVMYDELHEYDYCDGEDGGRILAEKVYLNGVLGAEAKYEYFETQPMEKCLMELNYYPVKGAYIKLAHREGDPVFLEVTEDETYERSSHIQECYTRDEEGNLVSGKLFEDGVLKKEYEFAPGEEFFEIKQDK